MEVIKNLSPEILTLLVALLIIIVGWFAKKGVELLEETKKDIKSNFCKIDRRLDISDMKGDARDYALDKLLPKNGNTYRGHVQERMEYLLQEYETINDAPN